MRRYSKVSGMTIVSCDAAGCGTDFRSCSVRSVIGDQLALYGWSVVVRGRARDRVTEHFCPEHKPKSVMSR
jgi:hypothetical protein